ncbi:hypothetical protein [Frisingicoccus sp.]|uniref:hypothetical protein n=1 Tax=Frisingicoccus sp. TaxID=1918627 RepID=UPI003AB49A07
MDGQAYVTVQAQEATTYSTRAGASGGGSVTGSYIITWTFTSGISDVSWTIPGNDRFPALTIIPTMGDVESTNNAITAALSGKNYYYADHILRTWYCGQSI